MAFRVLVIVSILVAISSLLIAFHHKIAEKKIFRLYELNVNRSLCVLCLGNDSCDTINFQLDYQFHADLSHYSNYLIVFIVRLFNIWTNQNDKLFFGTLKLNDKTVVRAVAKSPGHYYSKMFDKIAKIPINLDKPMTYNQLTLLPFKMDNSLNTHSLVMCSSNNSKSHSMLHNFFYSTVNIENINNSHSWLETWTAAHLSPELLILKVLNGYSFAPIVYGTCGRVYFVEYCGYTLQYHLQKMNLNNRLLVARELLILSLELTNGTAHLNYSFYLTDLTADNIAVQFNETTGLLQSLKVIDWSDVIVVANDHRSTTNDEFKIHVSEHVDCGPGCLTYSKEDICEASISDHNVYAVCKEFLSDEGRLLHEFIDSDNTLISKEESQKLESLIEHCLWHSNTNQFSVKSRLETAQLMIIKIQKILQRDGIKYFNI